MLVTAEQSWIFCEWLKSIPPDAIKSVCTWAEAFVELVGSVRSKSYLRDISPWTVAPIENANDGTVRMTLVKAIQTGGSVVGEIALLFWLTNRVGDVAYFWPNDLAADDRWAKRFEKIMLACRPVMAKVPADRFKWQKGLVIFPASNFEMKGVRTDRAVSSDTVPFIVNEELHDVAGGWEPGRLQQVYGRQSACWQRVVFNISNSGFANSDLHKAFKSGTQQHWENKCPGCHQHHRMRIRFDKDRPDLGGLRYDAEGARLPNMEYDYNRIVAKGIFYQMPCGYKLPDDPVQRRAINRLDNGARYSEPENKGASLTERSYTYQSVICDFKPWLDIIKRKHEALRAMAVGNYKPWFDYLREEECLFVDEGKDRPAPERIEIVTTGIKKTREGLLNKAARLAGIDYQQGKAAKGQTPHFWLLIQDWDAMANSQVVWEGRCDTEGELAATLEQHGVTPASVVVDSSYQLESYIYNLCRKYGWNALKADQKMNWQWPDGTWRFYSEPRPLCFVANRPPSGDMVAEPQFWIVGKYSGMERLTYLMQSKAVRYIVPEDVSEDFTLHYDSWKIETLRQKDGQTKVKWRQLRDDDHLFQCGVYILTMVDMLSLFDGVGGMPAPAQPVQEPEVVNV